MGEVEIFSDVDVNSTTELLQYISRNRIDEKAIIEIIVTTIAMFNAILVEDPRVATPTKVPTKDLIKFQLPGTAPGWKPRPG